MLFPPASLLASLPLHSSFALAARRYVLEHFAESLPSFYALPEAQQKSVRFTQSKMAFNHGWLVQAEAPPAALFGKFKQVITRDKVEDMDVAFYFVHWLTDLAGAEPTPLEGSEKFVLKFPMPVLASFIKSFSIINELAHKTETEVSITDRHTHHYQTQHHQANHQTDLHHRQMKT